MLRGRVHNQMHEASVVWPSPPSVCVRTECTASTGKTGEASIHYVTRMAASCGAKAWEPMALLEGKRLSKNEHRAPNGEVGC
jgi:hypothetical protein